MLLKHQINFLPTDKATLQSVSDLGENKWNIDYHTAEDCNFKLSEASNGNIYENKLESLGHWFWRKATVGDMTEVYKIIYSMKKVGKSFFLLFKY